MPRSIPHDLETTRFDVIVVGAGINGVAIARDAAMRGLRVLVLDKGDIASGTTSWSTRLVHGGLRYLEHFEIGLVRESLRERERLLRNAPHLVKPLALILPIFRGAQRGPALIRTGMVLYDGLSFDKSLPRHTMLSARETIASVPSIEVTGLRASARYYDGQASMAERLSIENALSARDHGALILTYARVDRILTEGAVVRGVEFTDLLGGASIQARGQVVVNVAGPWVDRVLAGASSGAAPTRMIGGTKGSHLVVAPFPGAPADALYHEAGEDGRVIFVIPWNGNYLIGSTDIRYDGDLDDVRTDECEIAYLLKETNALLPGARLTADDVLYTYCGVRPLPYQREGDEGSITRKHVIHNHAPNMRGLLSIIGGKLTTHRSLAEEVVDEVQTLVATKTPSRTATTPLPGAAGIVLEPFARHLTAASTLPPPTVARLVGLYGVRAEQVIALAEADPALAVPFDDLTGAIAAEVVFAVTEEMAETLADILLRRTMVGLAAHCGVGPDRAAAAFAVTHLGWNPAHAEREIDDYRKFIERFQPKSLLAASPAHVVG